MSCLALWTFVQQIHGKTHDAHLTFNSCHLFYLILPEWLILHLSVNIHLSCQQYSLLPLNKQPYYFSSYSSRLSLYCIHDAQHNACKHPLCPLCSWSCLPIFIWIYLNFAQEPQVRLQTLKNSIKQPFHRTWIQWMTTATNLPGISNMVFFVTNTKGTFSQIKLVHNVKLSWHNLPPTLQTDWVIYNGIMIGVKVHIICLQVGCCYLNQQEKILSALETSHCPVASCVWKCVPVFISRHVRFLNKWTKENKTYPERTGAAESNPKMNHRPANAS